MPSAFNERAFAFAAGSCDGTESFPIACWRRDHDQMTAWFPLLVVLVYRFQKRFCRKKEDLQEGEPEFHLKRKMILEM